MVPAASNLIQHSYLGGKALEIKDDKLVEIAKIYADIFADPPWNEFKVCDEGHYSGRDAEALSLCSRCDAPLKEAYPHHETIEAINRHLSNRGGILITLENKEGAIYAAGWGSPYTTDSFSRIYKTKEMHNKCAEIVKAADIGETFFYLAEIMVKQELRRQGIATRIADRLLHQATQLGLKTTLHTHADSPMAKIANKMKMHRLYDVGEDSEIPGRVLFAT